jgi:hypothetical protein
MIMETLSNDMSAAATRALPEEVAEQPGTIRSTRSRR